LVEVANGGTLFLDEVGDISLTIQPKLLRFLETGEFRRVGGITNLKTNVRVISATNKNLPVEVEQKRFREDLLYRLNVVNLKLPSLIERKEDIALLAEHFITQKSKTKRLSKEAIDILTKHIWPGDIRELEHIIEGALVISQSDVIEPKDFSMNPALPRAANEERNPYTETPKSPDRPATIAQMEKSLIQETLKTYNYNRTKTSKTFGISPKTLYLKIRKYKIPVPKTF
jgi:DNA-binding NtrC family response regulator